VCDLYEQAAELHEQGVHLFSSDEKTGIQALERKHPDKPTAILNLEKGLTKWRRGGIT
jgi:hypothetical protein